MMLVPAVKVPAVSSVLPLMSSVAGAVKVPNVIVKSFVVMLVVLPPVESVLPLFTTKLLKVWLAALPLIAWAPVPSNVTVLLPCVNVAPLFVQSPVTVWLNDPALNVEPEPRTTLPFTSIGAAAAADAVPAVVKEPASDKLDAGSVLAPLPLNVRFPYDSTDTA